MKQQGVAIHSPLVIMYEETKGPNAGRIICAIHPNEDYDHRSYGLLINDLVQHVANAFDVRERDVWECVDKDRFNPDRGKVQQQPDGTYGSLATENGTVRKLRG